MVIAFSRSPYLGDEELLSDKRSKYLIQLLKIVP